MNTRTFSCSVWNGGYEWKTAGIEYHSTYNRYGNDPDIAAPCLSHPILNDDTYYEACERYKSRTYEPLKVPNLYEVFAQTETDKVGVMAFVKEYGLLGETAYSEAIGKCESILFWQQEILAVRRVLQIQDLIESSEEVQLAAFRWPDRDEYEILLIGATRMGAIGGILHMKPPQSHIEAWLLRVHLLIEINANVADRLRVELLFDKETLLLQPSYSPKTLIGAIWLQVFHRFAAGEAWKRCIVCERFLDIQSVRADAQYGSKACKQKALRQRKKELSDQSSSTVS